MSDAKELEVRLDSALGNLGLNVTNLSVSDKVAFAEAHSSLKFDPKAIKATFNQAFVVATKAEKLKQEIDAVRKEKTEEIKAVKEEEIKIEKELKEKKEEAERITKEGLALFVKANTEAKAYHDQQKVKLVLADCYEHGCGSLGIARDKSQAAEYRKIEEETEKEKNTEEEKNKTKTYEHHHIYDRIVPPPLLPFFNVFARPILSFYDKHIRPSMRSKNVYDKALWFTRIRLFELRGARELKFFGYGALASVGNILSFLGLSYFIEMGFDIAFMARATLFATIQEKELTPRWQDRLKNSYLKGDRRYRFPNAGIWGIGNAIGIGFPPASPFINLILFTYDFFADLIKLYHLGMRQYRVKEKIRALKNKIQNEYGKELETYHKQNAPEHEDYSPFIELEKNILLEKHLQNEMQAIIKKRAYLLFITSIILAGMLIILLPQVFPALIVSAGLLKVGGALALSGSVIGGFGKGVVLEQWLIPAGEWLWKKVKSCFGKKPSSPEIEMTAMEVVSSEDEDENKKLHTTVILDRLLKEKKPESSSSKLKISVEEDTDEKENSNVIVMTPSKLSVAARRGWSIFVEQSKVSKLPSKPTLAASYSAGSVLDLPPPAAPGSPRGPFSRAQSEPVMPTVPPTPTTTCPPSPKFRRYAGNSD